MSTPCTGVLVSESMRVCACVCSCEHIHEHLHKNMVCRYHRAYTCVCRECERGCVGTRVRSMRTCEPCSYTITPIRVTVVGGWGEGEWAAPCLSVCPLFHGPEEQGPCPWPRDQLSSWVLTPLPQQDRHGQGQGSSDNPDPHPHLHPKGLEQCPVELERSPNSSDNLDLQNNGLESREGGNPKARGRGGAELAVDPRSP